MDRKKTAIIIIVSCLILAVVITLVVGSNDESRLPDFKGKKTYVKCNNPDCGTTYEIGLKEYYEGLKKKPRSFGVPALDCKECGKESLYKALKCENCGEIFFYGFGDPADYDDRCPECQFSKTEQKREGTSN